MADLPDDRETLLRQEYHGQTARINWHDLQPQYAHGSVIRVAPDMNLVEVAVQLGMDNTDRFQQWIIADIQCLQLPGNPLQKLVFRSAFAVEHRACIQSFHTRQQTFRTGADLDIAGTKAQTPMLDPCSSMSSCQSSGAL